MVPLMVPPMMYCTVLYSRAFVDPANSLLGLLRVLAAVVKVSDD